MPTANQDIFNPSGFYRNGHFQTIIPNKFRKIPNPYLKRVRLELKDGDFIDLDCHQTQQKKLVILVHGLEGSSASRYMLGATRQFVNLGYDVVALNQRSCSGEMNRLPQLYHHGLTGDLKEALAFLAPNYETVFLLGFSLGGNQVLKLMGETPEHLPGNLRAAMAVSAPIFLPTCVSKIHEPQQWVYQKMFLNELKAKVAIKAQQFPDLFDTSKLQETKNLYDFDNNFTAPVFGFKNGQDYYQKASSWPFLPHIERPVLLLNALDDPMLSAECFPINLAANHPHFHLCQTQYGGHVGFYNNQLKSYFAEVMAADFFAAHAAY
jgi:uncharacterized protein